VGLIEIGRALIRLGHRVTVISPRCDKYIRNTEGLELRPMGTGRLHELLTGIPITYRFASIVGQQVDAVISFAYEAVPTHLIARSLGIKTAILAAFPSYELRTSSLARLDPRQLKEALFIHRPLRSADHVFALSDFTARELQKLDVERARIVVNHWGVDPAFFSVEREYSDSTNLLFFGSGAAIKGSLDAVRAVGLAKDDLPAPWVLRLVGPGDTPELRRAIDEAGLSGKIEILPFANQRELLRHLAWASVAVLPSRVESFGLAIAEAQAAGLPVVSYRVGSVPEVVLHGHGGWLVEPHKQAQLASAIASAAADPAEARRRGQRGRERVRREFSWEMTAHRIVETLWPTPEGRAAVG
jgi:glycosyltransferase involved in cell wall biosynthesis